MTDREKVIKKAERMICSKVDRDMIDSFCEDVIDLLKEREEETVESIQMDRSDKWGADLTGYCPSCKRPLKSRFNKRFCGECGQAVKWE